MTTFEHEQSCPLLCHSDTGQLSCALWREDSDNRMLLSLVSCFNKLYAITELILWYLPRIRDILVRIRIFSAFSYCFCSVEGLLWSAEPIGELGPALRASRCAAV
jgi:hypothetical protein